MKKSSKVLSAPFYTVISLICFFVYVTPGHAIEAAAVPDFAVLVRVLDVGNGLATVAKLPGGHHVVYDIGVGNGVDPDNAIAEIKKVIRNQDIDLLILSHPDPEHYSALNALYDAGISINQIVRTGHKYSNRSWKRLNRLINKKDRKGLTEDINLSERPLPAGSEFVFGEVSIRVLSGFSEYPHLWHDLGHRDDAAELIRDAISIVARLEFRGSSVLFTSDGLGKLEDEAAEAIATERFLLENRGVFPLNSEALIVPRGAGKLGSSKQFIEAVQPEFLAISAGHGYGLPNTDVIHRYLDIGVTPENMFRTDIGDDEPDSARRLNRGNAAEEWSFGRNKGEKDQPGDEHIDILVCSNGKVRVGYTADKSLSCVWSD